MIIFFRLLNLFSVAGITTLYLYPDIVATVVDKDYHTYLYLAFAFILGLSLLSWFTRRSKTAVILNDIPYALRSPFLIIRLIWNKLLRLMFVFIGFVAVILFVILSGSNNPSTTVATPENVITFSYSFCFFLALCFLIGLYIYNYGMGIVIDAKKNRINFPAKNKLSSFKEFITMRFLFGQFFRRTVKFTDIQYIHSVTETKYVSFYTFNDRDNHYKDKEKKAIKKYLLNCAGTFGSFYLAFSSVQKRDEAISVIKATAKELNHKIEFRNILY